MKTAVMAILLFAASFCLAQESPGQSADTSMLIALENAWNQAQLHHDSKALDELLADTFVSTDNDGVLMTKAQYLADNKDPSYTPSTMANSDVKVFVYKGGMAVVVGIYHAKGTSSGKAFDRHGRFTDTWVRQNGKWQCVATHTSNLKKVPIKE
jgi:ketosteroid isomerase-like protein